MLIKVDLRSKVIGHDHSAFMVRPGSNYKLYNVFLETEAIFADILGLELRAGVSLEQQDQITAQLHRARAIRSFRRTNDAPPSRRIEDYADLKNDHSIRLLISTEN